ncbi:MAG: carboxypeptidase-like regulatory domain-containing protein [Candidatus Poseidoniaceae archaeon]|nr:carboxypeptidase-like regulatory domain-containing protein [Candidatus Poseidoniaceae archaeon]
MIKAKATLLVALMLCSLIVSMVSAEEPETFTLTGRVYDVNGEIADSTSIKVDSLTSSWSDTNGTYVFEGITPGVHTVRAYFMNNGHTVVYRTMNFQSDMQIDWYEGLNWITAEVHDSADQLVVNDSSNTTIQLIQNQQVLSPNNGNVEFDLQPIGSYYTLKSLNDGGEQGSQYIHFRMQSNTPNHFVFQDGTNSVYGFLTDVDGQPLTATTVSNGETQTVTNNDGFFLLQNLPVGSTQNLTFMKSDYEAIPASSHLVTSGAGWLNLSSVVTYVFPGAAQFVNSEQTIPLQTTLIEWIAGNSTQSYHLYLDDDLLYTGINTYYEFTPESQGSYDFTLISFNENGSTESPDALLLIVLGDAINDDLWSVGMSWDYHVAYTPTSADGMHNVSITALEKETLVDAFGKEQTVFKTRHKDDMELEGEKSYRWYDTTNLLPIRTYWRDAPFESSYFMEGSMGWNFSAPNSSTPTSLFSDLEEYDLHFNRTNVIGVPGHPNGYDDTFNRVTRSYEEITTPAGTFQTTHYSMVDLNDGIVSWELWYNDTVRNFVKRIDRLPGSHSEKVVYELSSFDVPTTPQFITEPSNVSTTDYSLEWAEYQGADSYVLMIDDSVIYEGNLTTFEVKDQLDGVYTYKILAHMANGFQTEATELSINVFEIVNPPEVTLMASTIVEGDSLSITWTSAEDIAWYSLLVQNEQGTSYEAYNGTSSSFDMVDLEPGINRIRVSTGLENGKISDYSSSVFITVDDAPEPKDTQLLEVSFTIGLVILFGWILTSAARKD